MNIFKKISVGILPILTLIIGWQLGTRSATLQANPNHVQSIHINASGAIISNPEAEVDLKDFWHVWRLLLSEYIEPETLDSKTMTYGAIAGMVRSIKDPYTVFMTPQENTDFRDTLDGNLQGIGAELTMREEVLMVVAPLKGSPAMKAGLQPEDIIVSIDEKSTEGIALNDLIKSIRGPAGTTVTLGILREKEPEILKLTITREEITVPSTEYETKTLNGKTIGYIAINQFGDHTTTDMQEAMDSFRATKLDGIIIDVRFNGGGYLDKSIDIVSMFLNEGTVVSIDRRNSKPQVHTVHGNAIDTKTPIVVLINKGSASASEIVAGSLQDHKRATIIGETSFGKGTIQELYPLKDGSSIRITVAKWLTPNGKNLGHEGVHPDHEVERTIEQMKEKIDPQLDAAMEFLVSGTVPKKTGSGTTK